MINYKRLLRITIPISFVLFVGCDKSETPPDEYVAKVNDSYLTEADIEVELESGLKFREEFINQWIEDELLSQEAHKNGITTEENFERIIENSKKELSAALALKKHFNKINPEVNLKALENYFELNRKDFKLPQKGFIINKADFTDEETAIKFRNYLLENDWTKALNKFENIDGVESLISQKLFYPFQIQPAKIYRITNEMMPDEVSIIVEAEPNIFEIVQLIKKYDAEEIPDFEYVEEEVRERFLTYQKKLIYKEYIEKLYSENQVEINQ